MIFDGLAPGIPYLLENIVPFNGFPYLSSSSVGILYHIVEPGDNSLNYYSEFISYEDPVLSSPQYTSLEFVPFETTVAVNFDIDLSSQFDFGNDIIILVIEEHGNIVDGKTHLDSVAEAVVKAILSALVAFVKAVTELVSKALDWIWKLISSIFKGPIDNIAKMIEKEVNKILTFISNLLSIFLRPITLNTLYEFLFGPIQLLFTLFSSPLYLIIFILVTVLTGVSLIIAPFLGIVQILMNLAIDFILPIILNAVGKAIGGQIGNLLSDLQNGLPYEKLFNTFLGLLPGSSSTGGTGRGTELDPLYAGHLIILTLAGILGLITLANVYKGKVAAKKETERRNSAMNEAFTSVRNAQPYFKVMAGKIGIAQVDVARFSENDCPIMANAYQNKVENMQGDTAAVQKFNDHELRRGHKEIQTDNINKIKEEFTKDATLVILNLMILIFICGVIVYRQKIVDDLKLEYEQRDPQEIPSPAYMDNNNRLKLLILDCTILIMEFVSILCILTSGIRVIKPSGPVAQLISNTLWGKVVKGIAIAEIGIGIGGFIFSLVTIYKDINDWELAYTHA